MKPKYNNTYTVAATILIFLTVLFLGYKINLNDSQKYKYRLVCDTYISDWIRYDIHMKKGRILWKEEGKTMFLHMPTMQKCTLEKKQKG